MYVYIKGQSGFILCLHVYFKTDALMLEMLKVLRYVACVKYCMNKGSNAMYVKCVERSSKWSYTSLLIGCSLLLLSTRFLGQDQHLQLSWTLHQPAPDPLLRPNDGRYSQKGWYPRCDPTTRLAALAAERIPDRKSASRCVMTTLHLGRDDRGKENAVSPP